MSGTDTSSTLFGLSQKAIISDGKGRILLLEKAGSHHWDLPGGKLEQGEAMPDGLEREVREETDLKIRIGQIIHADIRSFPEEEKPDRLMLFYLCKPRGNVKSITLSSEHKSWKLAERKDIKGMDMNDVMRTALETAFGAL